MPRHAMVNIESLGTQIGSAILSIGAVMFDPLLYDPKNISTEAPTFYTTIDLADSLHEGLTVDEERLSQSNAARRSLVIPESVRLRKALDALVLWYRSFRKPGATAVWSHGLSFDLMLLSAAFSKTGIRPPWHYRDMRDTWTLFDLATPYGYELTELSTTMVSHDPLNDAIQQAQWVQREYHLIAKGVKRE